MAEIDRLQKRVCRMYRVDHCPPTPQSKLGIALATLEDEPILGVRLAAENGTNGWHIHGGQPSDADDFYDPLCIDDLFARCPLALPFLGLPPGWRFRTDSEGTFEAWFDGTIEL
ncbi:MAG: hypothetical protein AB8B91_16020 [Rubripirellula sp.]